MYMKEIKLITPSEKMIGNVRVSLGLFNKIEKFAKDNGVSNQEIIRAVLENCIDEVKFN